MPEYIQSNVRKKYISSANPPILDRVVFTIDHIHNGNSHVPSTLEVVRFLINKKIPVTVFMECKDPRNKCFIDQEEAQKIYNLNPDLITLGVHSLSIKNTQEKQSENLELINDVILNITGSRSTILSYHGKNAGPEPGIHYNNIIYARGINTWSAPEKDDPLNTPVMGLKTVKSAFEYIKRRNEYGLSATLFVHSVELRNGSPKKRVFDTLVKEVEERRLQALDYYSAMERDFSPNPECPLHFFTNSILNENLHKGHQDGKYGVSQVAELQAFLNEVGADAGEVDGIYGQNTEMAVLMYQIDKNLATLDGAVNDETRASINNYCQ